MKEHNAQHEKVRGVMNTEGICTQRTFVVARNKGQFECLPWQPQTQTPYHCLVLEGAH